MGLLDILNTDEGRLGIGLLAAGGPSAQPMSVGQRIAQALAGVSAGQDGDLRRQLLKSQIAENGSQDAVRQQQLALMRRKQAMQEGLLGYGSGPSQAAPSQFGQAPTSRMDDMQNGLLGAPPSGGQMPPSRMQGVQEGQIDAPPMGSSQQGGQQGGLSPATPVNTPGGPMTLQQLSQTFGIPYPALAFDLVNNDGKGIAEMVFKRGTPDMQVANGYAYDKNKQQPGYLPSLQSSSDGQVTQVQIGPNGQPVVSAPQGALNTYSAYRGAAAGVQAANTPGRPALGPDGRPRGQSQAQEIGGGAMPPAAGGSGLIGNFQGPAEDVLAQINAIRDPQERSNAMTAYANQMTRSPAGGALDLSAQEKQDMDTAGKFGGTVAAKSGEALLESRDQARTAADTLTTIRQTRKALDGGAFGGAGADFALTAAKFADTFGVKLDPARVSNTDYVKSTLGQGLLEKAKTLGANPTNADANRIETIIGSIDKDPQALAKLLDLQEEIAKRSITRHNSTVADAEKRGLKSPYDLTVKEPEALKADAPAPRRVDTLPPANSSNRGKQARDTTTGELLESNGLSWVKVKAK